MYKRLVLATTVFMAVVLGSTTTQAASAAPPPYHGTAPVAASPIAGFGGISGEDVSDSKSCTIGGQQLLFIGGNFTAWRGIRTSRLIAVSPYSGKLLWQVSQLGASTGWLQQLVCYVASGGKSGMLYIGGNFTSVMGHARSRSAAISIISSGGRLHFALSGWTVPSKSQVNGLAVGDGKVYVTVGGSVEAVSLYAAHRLWTTTGNCGLTHLFYHAGSLYLGGFFTQLQHGSNRFNQYGLARLHSSDGTFVRSFNPHLTRNQKLCNDPTATGHQTYSGNIPLSFAWSYLYHRLIVGGGGKHNTLGEVNVSNGSWAWLIPEDGDGQTVSEVGHYVFYGHHRSGNALTHYTHERDSEGGFFAQNNGQQAKWAGDSAIQGNGPNHDLRNNGSITSVVYRTAGKLRLCIGGAMTKPYHGFNCYLVK